LSSSAMHCCAVARLLAAPHTSAYVSMRQHASACASRIRQHTSAYASTAALSRGYSQRRIRQHASAYVSMRQPHTSAYVSIRQHYCAVARLLAAPHTSAYVSMRQHFCSSKASTPARYIRRRKLLATCCWPYALVAKGLIH
jgi:hypothetical protein